eukprot:2602147-Amphidinium_carterae.1
MAKKLLPIDLRVTGCLPPTHCEACSVYEDKLDYLVVYPLMHRSHGACVLIPKTTAPAAPN